MRHLECHHAYGRPVLQVVVGRHLDRHRRGGDRRQIEPDGQQAGAMQFAAVAEIDRLHQHAPVAGATFNKTLSAVVGGRAPEIR